MMLLLKYPPVIASDWGRGRCFYTTAVITLHSGNHKKPQSGKNVIEHPPVFIFTTCASTASIFEKIVKGLDS